MVLLARDISKQIEAELEYPGQIKVNVIRESRVTDYAKIKRLSTKQFNNENQKEAVDMSNHVPQPFQCV